MTRTTTSTGPTSEPYQGSPSPLRICRLPRVIDMVDMGRATIYRLYKQGKFPAPINLTSSVRPNGRAVASGWLEHEIIEWINARAAERVAPKSPAPVAAPDAKPTQRRAGRRAVGARS